MIRTIERSFVGLLGVLLLGTAAGQQAQAKAREPRADAEKPAAASEAGSTGATAPDGELLVTLKAKVFRAYQGPNGFGDASVEGKRRLAAKLLGESRESVFDDNDRYAMLDTALDLATATWDVETAFLVVEEINHLYAGNARDRIVATYSKLASGAAARAPAADCAAVAARGLEMIEGAIAEADPEFALLLLDEANRVADASGDDELQSRLSPLSTGLYEYSHAMKALEALKSDPANPQANSDAGLYFLSKGDFAVALPYLAKGVEKGVNGELRELAIEDLACPPDPVRQEDRGITWAAFGQKTTPRLRRPALLRALAWDEIVIPQVKSLDQKRVRNHATDLRQLLEANTGNGAPEIPTISSGAGTPARSAAAPARPGPGAAAERVRTKLDWAEIRERDPDPRVITDVNVRKRIRDTGLPWRVRDKTSGIEMLCVPHGMFRMGAPQEDAEADAVERPAHDVTITRDFYLARYETQQSEWARVMSGAADGGKLELPKSDVTFNDIQSFLAASDGLRLPTEAEWEFAARAGCEQPRFEELDKTAWYEPTAEDVIHPVGGLTANGLGFHDMLGNVWEWCADWHDGTAYKKLAQGGTDPVVLDNPKKQLRGRVLRGGSCDSTHRWLRLSTRIWLDPGSSRADGGFRVARDP